MAVRGLNFIMEIWRTERNASALPWIRICVKNKSKIIDFERELPDGSR